MSRFSAMPAWVWQQGLITPTSDQCGYHRVLPLESLVGLVHHSHLRTYLYYSITFVSDIMRRLLSMFCNKRRWQILAFWSECKNVSQSIASHGFLIFFFQSLFSQSTASHGVVDYVKKIGEQSCNRPEERRCCPHVSPDTFDRYRC